MGRSFDRLIDSLGDKELPVNMSEQNLKEVMSFLEKHAEENPELDMHFIITGKERQQIRSHINFSNSSVQIDKYHDNTKEFHKSVVFEGCQSVEGGYISPQMKNIILEIIREVNGEINR